MSDHQIAVAMALIFTAAFSFFVGVMVGWVAALKSDGEEGSKVE